MNFSTNQVRQFYVANAAGDLTVVTKNGLKYIQLKEGGRSDLIDPKKITHIEHTLASELALYDKSKTVTLESFEAGKVYTIKVVLTNLYGAGDEVAHPIVAAASGASKGEVLTSLANTLTESVKKNYPFIKFVATATSGSEKLTVETVLAEAIKGWDPAIAPIKDITFEVYGDGLTVSKGYTKGAVVTGTNGKKLAELEWFCMGERADQYRMAGYPNVVKTEYKINPASEYDVIDINYYFDDSKEGVQKSEKVITIACPTAVAATLLAEFGMTKDTKEQITPDDEDFLKDA